MRQPAASTAPIEYRTSHASLGVTVGATMTVTQHNLDEVVPLARLLQERGVVD